MLSVTKVLPLIFLLLQTSNANSQEKYHKRFSRSVRITQTPLEQNYDNESVAGTLPNINNYKDAVVVSTNKPTLITFRKRTSNLTYKGDALVTRMSSGGSVTETCTFPAIASEYTEIEMLAYSMENNMEILLITKWLDDENPSTDLFVVNMTDCNYTKEVIPLEFSDFPRQNMGLIVLRPWDFSQFTIFLFDGWRICNSYICKRVFDISNNVLSRPTKFYWLTNESDQDRGDIHDLLPLKDNKFVAIQIPKPAKARFVALTERGSSINSMDFSTGDIKFIKSSYSFGDQSICYTSVYDARSIHCQMVEASQDFVRKLNITINMGYKIEALAIRNIPLNRIMILTLGCGSAPNCERYVMQLTKIESDSSRSLFKEFNSDENCVPKSEFYLTLYEEGRNICVYYQCDLANSSVNYNVMIKCFQFEELSMDKVS